MQIIKQHKRENTCFVKYFFDTFTKISVSNTVWRRHLMFKCSFRFARYVVMQIALTRHDVHECSANPSHSGRLLYIGLRSGTPITLIVARQERKEETQRSGGVKAKFTSCTRAHACVRTSCRWCDYTIGITGMLLSSWIRDFVASTVAHRWRAEANFPWLNVLGFLDFPAPRVNSSSFFLE